MLENSEHQLTLHTSSSSESLSPVKNIVYPLFSFFSSLLSGFHCSLCYPPLLVYNRQRDSRRLRMTAGTAVEKGSSQKRRLHSRDLRRRRNGFFNQEISFRWRKTLLSIHSIDCNKSLTLFKPHVAVTRIQFGLHFFIDCMHSICLTSPGHSFESPDLLTQYRSSMLLLPLPLSLPVISALASYTFSLFSLSSVPKISLAANISISWLASLPSSWSVIRLLLISLFVSCVVVVRHSLRSN